MLTQATSSETMGWQGHGQVYKFSADHMRDAGVHLGPSKRQIYVPRSVKLTGRRFARLVAEPVMDEMLAMGIEPFEVLDAGYNLLCNGGINRLESLLLAAGGQGYDNTHTSIGVGDGNGSVPTAAATDTDLTALTGATHRYVQTVDATYPSAATQVVTVQSTFATGNANFEWREWAIDQTTASGTAALTTPLLNHKGVDLGLKTSAAAWAFKVTITIS